MIKAAAIRTAAYALTSILASAFYVGWIVADVGGPGSFKTRLTAAILVYLFGGFAAALVLMIVPWAVVVSISRRAQPFGAVYCACSGAFLMILIGCVASSLSPKPLFVVEQSFLDGILITLKRAGACLALSGMIFGFGYWFIAERNQKDKSLFRPTPT